MFKTLSGLNGQNLWVCSDVHGCLWHLQEAIRIVAGESLLILGDVIDRGPSSRECLELIMATPNVDMCLGNHEIKWLQLSASVDFLGRAGVKYLVGCPLVFVWGTIYMAHTYIEPSAIQEGHVDWWMIYENEYEWVHEWEWDYTLISGHIPTRTHPAYGLRTRRPGSILRHGSRILIDGGTPTTGILPLYNVTQDYEITIIRPVDS